MRKALFVGINHYDNGHCLKGCVNDAMELYNALSTNSDGSPNFEGMPLLAGSQNERVTQRELRYCIERLFDGEPDIALLYFSGHGSIDKYGTYLCTSDTLYPREALSLREVMDIAELSRAKHKVIILDCCHSGGAGSSQKTANVSTLPSNTTILAACRDRETSLEVEGQGLFTSLLLGALEGGAANILGEITPASIYAFIEKSLGGWDQRPVFKANIEQFVCLKKHTPPIEIQRLREITRLFPGNPYAEFQLDPSYEEDKRDAQTEEDKVRNEAHEEDFAILRDLHKLNLVVPVGHKYMYDAAVKRGACKLTPLGVYYWMLLSDRRI